jgi:hypothetical protein
MGEYKYYLLKLKTPIFYSSAVFFLARDHLLKFVSQTSFPILILVNSILCHEEK